LLCFVRLALEDHVVDVSPVPAPTPSCGDSDLCRQIFEWTDRAWLAESSYIVLVKPIRIVLIILIAVIVRALLHRTINRLIRSTTLGTMPTVLRPLKERFPGTSQDATNMFPERRRQRAEAIGSVLRSFVTAVVYSVALLMILAEFSVNLGPLIASLGIVGVALGFGAQTLVKDLLAGLFMLLEDQYGVGDTVDVGEVNGTVEAVGLRVTTIRDARGVVWYVRNGEIVRVGNNSQGWSMVMVDVPIGFVGVDDAAAVLRRAAESLAEDPEYTDDLIEPPRVLGVEQITVDGAVIRTIAKTSAEAQFRVGRELRRRLTEGLESAGIAAQIVATRPYVRPPGPEGSPPNPA
jgi:small-conductance mechanosensitive channel